MSKPKLRFLKPPIDTLWISFVTKEALQDWVDGVRATSGPALVNLPSDDEEIVRFYMLQGRVLGLVVDAGVVKK